MMILKNRGKRYATHCSTAFCPGAGPSPKGPVFNMRKAGFTRFFFRPNRIIMIVPL